MSRIVEALERLCESNINLNNASEQEVVDIFMSTMRDYVDDFYNKVTTRCKIPDKGIQPRFSTDCYNNTSDIFIDYSCLYPSYSKETAKLALDIFKEYANIIISYVDVLKFKYPEIHYEIDKTIVSSSRIGKGLYIYDLPFKFPNEYYDKY